MVSEREIQAKSTRSKILDIAAEEILRCGFQSSSIGEIIKKANISKGCFYHHFSTKKELGYAVLDQSIEHVKTEIWMPMLMSENPLQEIINMFRNPENYLDCERVKLGCPINNLSQEMSPIDEGFREKIENMYSDWKSHLVAALNRCQNNNYMNSETNAEDIATLIIAVTQGATGIAKNAQQPKSFSEYTNGLTKYLQTLQLNSP
ncbi:MAG: TetR/AcrR family transcriptional regulator [Gammaproteobacteria bacterium]|nr:TetR/AcrR family transcriptional regulator [Gammaproteobacteria bacterium]